MNAEEPINDMLRPGSIRFFDPDEEAKMVRFLHQHPPAQTSALEREILTWYWCYSSPFLGGSEFWKPIHARAVQRFVKVGLLIEGLNKDTGLPKILPNRDALRAYMEALDAVPLPVQRWIVPENVP